MELGDRATAGSQLSIAIITAIGHAAISRNRSTALQVLLTMKQTGSTKGRCLRPPPDSIPSQAAARTTTGPALYPGPVPPPSNSISYSSTVWQSWFVGLLARSMFTGVTLLEEGVRSPPEDALFNLEEPITRGLWPLCCQQISYRVSGLITAARRNHDHRAEMSFFFFFFLEIWSFFFASS